eukprot:scaffold2635_cov106-Isochrysis_galbana.AAC.7
MERGAAGLEAARAWRSRSHMLIWRMAATACACMDMPYKNGTIWGPRGEPPQPLFTAQARSARCTLTHECFPPRCASPVSLARLAAARRCRRRGGWVKHGEDSDGQQCAARAGDERHTQRAPAPLAIHAGRGGGQGEANRRVAETAVGCTGPQIADLEYEAAVAHKPPPHVAPDLRLGHSVGANPARERGCTQPAVQAGQMRLTRCSLVQKDGHHARGCEDKGSGTAHRVQPDQPCGASLLLGRRCRGLRRGQAQALPDGHPRCNP